MATPWLRIKEEYRAYLEAAGFSADDFNDPSFKRADTFNAFNAFKQQQQQQIVKTNVPGDGIVDVDVLADRLAKRMKQSGPTKTSSTRGREELESLRFSKSVTRMTLNANLPPILTTEALKKLQNDFAASADFKPKISPLEAALTALLTPYLASIVEEVAQETQSGVVLSNTEYIRWLPPSVISPDTEWRKPDLLTAHPAVLISREPNGGDGIVNFRKTQTDWLAANRLFGGVEPDRISVDLVSSLWEGKCSLGNMHEALGDMVDYVRCFVIEESLVSFFLYDKFGYVGGYAKRGQITDLLVNANGSVIPWDANGSKEVLKTLLKNRIPDRMRVLEKIRCAFNASWSARPATSPYLGGGGFGDVYHVEVENKQLALKVAKKGHLKSEFDTLKQAHGDGAPVVRVLCGHHQDEFSAYTMEPVGTPIANFHPPIVSALFSSLYALHSCGWHHGDARWQNAIIFDGQLLWCDFLSAKKLQPLDSYYRAFDLHSLIESLLKTNRIFLVPTVSTIQGQLADHSTDYVNFAKTVLEAIH